MSLDWSTVGPRLVEPFCEPRWRVQRTTTERVQGKYPEGTRGLLVPYIDVRRVFSRLDELFGPENWQTCYRVLDRERGAVECSLSILGTTKSDVGYPNGVGAEEPLKAAYSDATKRAAVQWGIGRWLYEEDAQWKSLDQEGRACVDIPSQLSTETHGSHLDGGDRSSSIPLSGDPKTNGEATGKQLNYIEQLCALKGESLAAWPTQSKQEASIAIKTLMALPDHQTLP